MEILVFLVSHILWVMFKQCRSIFPKINGNAVKDYYSVIETIFYYSKQFQISYSM